jgi:anti-sigma factor RsiW
MTKSVDGTELKCREIIDFVMAYLDGELPERERAIFDAHLTICPECVNYVESYKSTMALTKRTQTSTETAPIPDDLVRAILAARKSTS